MMNKKKVLTPAISLVLAGVMCVGFAACGDGEAEKTPSEIAQNFVSEKIDEATWNEVFKGAEKGADGLMLNSFNNVKMEVEFIRKKETEAYKAVAETTATLIYANCMEYVKITEKMTITGELPDEYKEYNQAREKEYEYYITYTYDEEEVAFNLNSVIMQKNGKWVHADYYDIPYDWPLLTSISDSLGMIGELSALYSEFEYSEEEKGYIFTGSNSIPYILKFKDNKLKTVYVGAEEVGDALDMFYYFVFTYGGQSVTLPEVTE